MTDLKTLALAAKNNNLRWPNAEEIRWVDADFNEADAAYIAAASPDAIMKLLAERDRLREALAQITGINSSAIGDNQAFKAIQSVARQALEAK